MENYSFEQIRFFYDLAGIYLKVFLWLLLIFIVWQVSRWLFYKKQGRIKSIPLSKRFLRWILTLVIMLILPVLPTFLFYLSSKYMASYNTDFLRTKCRRANLIRVRFAGFTLIKSETADLEYEAVPDWEYELVPDWLLFESSDPNIINTFSNTLTFHPTFEYWSCMCRGELKFELLVDQAEIITFNVISGRRIRLTKLGSGDHALTPESQASLKKWLSDNGITIYEDREKQR